MGGSSLPSGKEGPRPLRDCQSIYFSSLLKKCGMTVVKEVVFSDHHFYTAKDLISIREKVKEVDWVVTTEKDMVKLRMLNIEPLPIRALRIELKIWEEEEFCKKVMEIFEIRS
jgi:tetraacyldisaccharide-1-P 4'-kinase